MEQHAFMARVDRAQQDRYIAAHREVPSELLARYREVGIRNISIFIHGDFLFLYFECIDYHAAAEALKDDPIEIEWQKSMSATLKGDGYRECAAIFHME